MMARKKPWGCLPQAGAIVDGCIRRGNHILNAMAQGANACSIGCGYLLGLAPMGKLRLNAA